MGGEDDGAARLVLGQQVPDGAPRVRVHTRRRLVQHHNPNQEELVELQMRVREDYTLHNHGEGPYYTLMEHLLSTVS